MGARALRNPPVGLLLRLESNLQSLVLAHCDASSLGLLEQVTIQQHAYHAQLGAQQVCTPFAPPPRPLSPVQREVRDRMKRLNAGKCSCIQQSWPAQLRVHEQTQEAARTWDMSETNGSADDLLRMVNEDEDILQVAMEACIRKVMAKLEQLGPRACGSELHVLDGIRSKCILFIASITTKSPDGWSSPVGMRCDVVVSAGGVATLVGVLQYGPDVAKSHAAAALANVTADPDAYDPYSAMHDRTGFVVASAGAVAALLGALQHGPDEARRFSAVALCNITRNKQHRHAVVIAGAVAVLLGVLQHTYEPGSAMHFAKLHSVAALEDITESEQHRDVVVSAGAVASLVGVLQHGPDDAKLDAAAALVNITASEQHAIVVGSAGAEAAAALARVLQRMPEHSFKVGNNVSLWTYMSSQHGLKAGHVALIDDLPSNGMIHLKGYVGYFSPNWLTHTPSSVQQHIPSRLRPDLPVTK